MRYNIAYKFFSAKKRNLQHNKVKSRIQLKATHRGYHPLCFKSKEETWTFFLLTSHIFDKRQLSIYVWQPWTMVSNNKITWPSPHQCLVSKNVQDKLVYPKKLRRSKVSFVFQGIHWRICIYKNLWKILYSHISFYTIIHVDDTLLFNILKQDNPIMESTGGKANFCISNLRIKTVIFFVNSRYLLCTVYRTRTILVHCKRYFHP